MSAIKSVYPAPQGVVVIDAPAPLQMPEIPTGNVRHHHLAHIEASVWVGECDFCWERYTSMGLTQKEEFQKWVADGMKPFKRAQCPACLGENKL